VQIGVGLPNTVPGIAGGLVLEWARRAEQRGFSALATIDRLVYPTYDSLTSLAAAAGATSRIGLITNILLAPAYPPVWLAKATASLDQLSGGRLTLGLGVGGRPDDFAAVERPFHRRGRLMDDTLDLLHRAWAQEPVAGSEQPVGPAPTAGRVPILIGGTSARSVERTVRWGAGWTAGGGGPDLARPVVEQLRSAWKEAGRDGDPRLAALVYFSLGDDRTDESLRNLRDYYGFLGEWTERVAQSATRDQGAARDVVRAFADIGMTEIYFVPTAAAPDQLDVLADAVL
jgi:alkanesulfonate monooxygenase SsuD/methylene tetrahydromethanopterin reductase-like flavin-dependent oxidoreductase (luciferase family)